MEMIELIILLMSIALAYCTDPCPLKLTCHECIQNPNCAWCAQDDRLPSVSTKIYNYMTQSKKGRSEFIILIIPNIL